MWFVEERITCIQGKVKWHVVCCMFPHLTRICPKFRDRNHLKSFLKHLYEKSPFDDVPVCGVQRGNTMAAVIYCMHKYMYTHAHKLFLFSLSCSFPLDMACISHSADPTHTHRSLPKHVRAFGICCNLPRVYAVAIK